MGKFQKSACEQENTRRERRKSESKQFNDLVLDCFSFLWRYINTLIILIQIINFTMVNMLR